MKGKEKLCLGTNEKLGMNIFDQILLFKQVGFEAFFARYDLRMKDYAVFARKHGMIFQSVHAPIKNADKLWESADVAKIVVDEWTTCINDCAETGIPIMIIHPFRGIEKIGKPTALGVENFKKVVDVAVKRNVKIAIENCEGEEYLKVLLDAFSDCENVGFCWDTGHELCYNRGVDMMRLFGCRLISTHLNDNMGVTSADGKISSADDLHLLPFDGKTDWKSVAKRLARVGYDGILTFELKKTAPYADMCAEEYVNEAFKRAFRVSELLYAKGKPCS